MFHRGMPTSWRERVESVPIRNIDDALIELRANYKVCERLEASRGQHGRGGSRGQFNRKGNYKPEHGQGSKSRQRQEVKSQTAREKDLQATGKRKRGNAGGKGCSYCEEQGMPFFQNHVDEDCFRNPDSPSYRPRANKRFKKSGAVDPKPKPGISAAQFCANDEDGSDADLDAAYDGIPCNDAEVNEVAVAGTPTAGSRKTQIQVQLRHPLSKKTVTALLDSGCDRSIVAKEVVSWYVPKQRGQYRNAAGKLEETCGNIELPFKIEDFGASRQVSHEFLIAEHLIYRIILGNDFMEEQEIVLDYKTHQIH